MRDIAKCSIASFDICKSNHKHPKTGFRSFEIRKFSAYVNFNPLFSHTPFFAFLSLTRISRHLQCIIWLKLQHALASSSVHHSILLLHIDWTLSTAKLGAVLIEDNALFASVNALNKMSFQSGFVRSANIWWASGCSRNVQANANWQQLENFN